MSMTCRLVNLLSGSTSRQNQNHIHLSRPGTEDFVVRGLVLVADVIALQLSSCKVYFVEIVSNAAVGPISTP